MPAIIYQKTPGGLFATGERTVSTFTSGLVRVDQTFICQTSAAATHRAALAVGNDMPGGSAPAIDGLKIYPEPQEKRRTDGFTEFVVSAYGRTNTSGTNSRRLKFIPLRSGAGWQIEGSFLSYVIKKNDSIAPTPQYGTVDVIGQDSNIQKLVNKTISYTKYYNGQPYYVTRSDDIIFISTNTGGSKFIYGSSSLMRGDEYQFNGFGEFIEVSANFSCPTPYFIDVTLEVTIT